MKRGQAALEFLMTYGWALLALFVAMGFIGYTTGFFTAWAPPRCATGLPFICSEFKVTDDGRVQLNIDNAGGTGTIVHSVTLWCDGDPMQQRTAVFDQLVAPQKRINTSDVFFSCPAGDSRFKGTIEINYVYSGQQQNHTAPGVIRAKVEP